MANRIKGITVEIGGDTTKLQNALKGVNGQIKNTQSALKDVEKLLKLDPTNTTLLAQKQKLLTQAIGETKEKLATLKTAAQQANEQLQKYCNDSMERNQDGGNYSNQCDKEHLKQIQSDNSRIAFWKRDKYSYQQEYRFLIHDFVDDYLSVEIGDISDITQLLRTEELLNTYLEITFKVKEV